MYLIQFRIELAVLNASVQIYTMPNFIPGFRVICRSLHTVPGIHQRGLVVKIWAMSLGI